MEPFKEFITKSGETLLYVGEPNISLLDELALGPGDLWHSSLQQGLKNAFDEIIYQTAVYWWFLNDFDDCETCISWRVNEKKFVIRKTVWEKIECLDEMYESKFMSGLDLGYSLLRTQFGIPVFVKDLFKNEQNSVKISKNDCYLFYRKHFKIHHSYYMMYRKGIFNFYSELKAYKHAKKYFIKKESKKIPIKILKEIAGKPTVSLVIPTMRRQAFTQLILNDHKNQTYPITQVVIVDATPKNERNVKYYNQRDFPFKIDVKWQSTKGSCKARNEALELCKGDYIIFVDDDIRVLPDFVENHIRFLQTYKADACNGLDIMAKNSQQNLTDLQKQLKLFGKNRWHAGVAQSFSNANSCVKREWIKKVIGNDINFDGGYGEDSDFGLRLIKLGAIVLHNPYAANLHLKPQTGGYRWWGLQASLLGNKRKPQPWELDKPVKFIKPIPSPTITYGILKHFKPNQIKEWRKKHFFIYIFKAPKNEILLRIFKYPYKQIQFSKSLTYAKKLMELGPRYK